MRPERLVLSNGVRILYAPSPANPFVAFGGSIPGGIAAEPPRQPGLAELTARLLLGGTRKRSAGQLARAIEGLGATLSFHNDVDAVAFSGRATREDAPSVLRVLREVLESSAFPDVEVEKARAELANDLRIESDDTRARASRELLSAIYPRGHPYGRNPKGSEASIRRIARRDVAAFHGSSYRTEGMIVALSGDVDRNFAEGAVAPILEAVELEAGPMPPVPAPPAPARNTRTIAMPHKSQVDLAIGGPALARGDPGFHVLSLGNLLFGRIGLFGRLGENLREERGLAYYSYSALVAHRRAGHVQIAVGVNPSDVRTALAAVRSEMERLRTDPFSEEEIERGRRNLIGGLAVNLERNAEAVEELHHIEYHGLGLDYLERFPDVVRGLPADAVRSSAASFFNPDAMSLVAAGPLADRDVHL